MSWGFRPAAIGRQLKFFKFSKLFWAIRKQPGYVKLLLYALVAIVFGGVVFRMVHKRRVSTFVFTSEDTRRVWEWEIESGHFMSWRPSRLPRRTLCGLLISLTSNALAAPTSKSFVTYSDGPG